MVRKCFGLTRPKLMSAYPNDALSGFGDQLALELFGHLRVEELVEGPLDGQGALPVPLLHLMAKLVSVVELLDFVKVGLVPGVPERGAQGGGQRGGTFGRPPGVRLTL